MAEQFQSTIREATSVYSNDTSTSTREAFESIILTTTQFTVKQIDIEQYWSAPDGTVWYLVSMKTKYLKELYKDAANQYKNQIAEKIVQSELNYYNAMAELQAKKLDSEIEKLLEEKITNEFIEIRTDLESLANSFDPSELVTLLDMRFTDLGYVD